MKIDEFIATMKENGIELSRDMFVLDKEEAYKSVKKVTLEKDGEFMLMKSKDNLGALIADGARIIEMEYDDSVIDILREIYEIEDKLLEHMNSVDIEVETGVISYQWSEAFNDLKLLGVDIEDLVIVGHYGYHIDGWEVPYMEYLSMVRKLEDEYEAEAVEEVRMGEEQD